MLSVESHLTRTSGTPTEPAERQSHPQLPQATLLRLLLLQHTRTMSLTQRQGPSAHLATQLQSTRHSSQARLLPLLLRLTAANRSSLPRAHQVELYHTHTNGTWTLVVPLLLVVPLDHPCKSHLARPRLTRTKWATLRKELR